MLSAPVLFQYLKPTDMYSSFLWVLNYLFEEAVIYPNQNLHFWD